MLFMSVSGLLYVVATPIGNLGDLSQRVTDVLSAVQFVAAEDTRRSGNLLRHLGLSKPFLRCDEAAENRSTVKILEHLANGNSVAFMTDAGSPGISDPGSRLVDAVLRAGYTVVPIAGPSAVTAALSVSGFPASQFRFLGFLARKGKARAKSLQEIAIEAPTSVFFESPYRVAKTLHELANLAPSRPALVARELTKKYEELVRGTLSEVAEHFDRHPPRGEFTVVVAPLPKAKRKPRTYEEKIAEEE
jgi:16S rRNA (cytidine1402-2'-O)-methyltransferase